MGIGSTVTFKDSVTLNFLLRVSRNDIDVKMRKLISAILILCLSLGIYSCSNNSDEDDIEEILTPDTTAATLAEVTAVTTPTNDTTPDYTFSSSEAGTITYGGSCSSSTTSATSGNNTITFNALAAGTYSNCTITVTDSAGNASSPLSVNTFVVDTTAPTVSSISTTADNQSLVSITDNITVTFSKAIEPSYVTTSTSDTNCAGSIRVSSDNFSTCVKMSSEPVSSNSNQTFTLDPYDNLTVGTTYLTRVTTAAKDTAGNAMSSQYDNSTGFTLVDFTAPTISSVSTTADNQSLVSITDNITVTFSESMNTSYVTTSTSDTNCAGTIRVSSDNFSSCVKMSSEPASSNSNKTFTLDPYDNLTRLTTYLTRVTTGVKDTAGNAMGSQYETSSGFTTDNSSITVSNSGPTSGGTYSNGTTYYWKVVASDPKGGSAQSETWSFTVQE